MIRRTLKRSEYEATPHEAWNAYVNLLAMESPEELTDTQRYAHFAFWYDSELQNGGHLQYFENHGTQYLDATLHALQVVGADSQHAVLSSAAARCTAQSWGMIQTVEEYVATARDGEFDDLDEAYFDCQPTIPRLLEFYFDSHFGEFVELV